MTSALADLIELLPPPATPHATVVDWDAVENNLRLQLPDDYKRFIETYGNCTICHTLAVLHPENGDWAADSARLLTDVIDSVNRGRDRVPYPNYPTPGGLFPIIQRENDLVCWVTQGNCNEWTLLYWSTWGIVVYELPMSLTQFLVELLSPQLSWTRDEFPDVWFELGSEYRKAEPYVPPPTVEYEDQP